MSPETKVALIVASMFAVLLIFIGGMNERDNHHRTERECIRAEKYGPVPKECK